MVQISHPANSGILRPVRSRRKQLLCLLTSWLMLSTSATLPSLAAPTGSRAGTGGVPAQRPGRSGGKPGAKKPAARVSRLKIQVPCRAWVPRGVLPKVVLLCVHGLGLNSASYEDFGKRMADLGIATFAVDVRGFGTWMQLKGRTQVDFDTCLGDVQSALKVLHTAYPKLPIYVLGESMGGAIALRVTAKYPELVDGLISAVPSGDRFKQKRTEMKVALHMLEGPNKPFDVGTKVIDQATQDEELRTEWKADPFNRLNLSPKELMQFQHFMNENHESAKLIDKKPVLIIQGFKDKLVKPEGTIELFNELSTADKVLVVLGDKEHLIFEENQFSDEVIWMVLGWVKSRIERPGGS